MMDKPHYIDWLIEEIGITIKDGIRLKCYRIDYRNDEEILNEWALHIRRHYISDEDLIFDSEINGMSVTQYLREYVIPQKDEAFGPTSRSGDIAEILVADLLEFVLGYSVPRYKQRNRSGKNNSEHGTDVIAYRFYKKEKIPSEKDELIAAEVKGKLSSDEYSPIESAIKDSQKDEHRLAKAIDYCRKRLREIGNKEESEEITRFLMKPDNNYKITYLAAGISSREKVDDEIELSITGEELSIRNGQVVFFIHGKRLMELTHNIYERCIK